MIIKYKRLKISKNTIQILFKTIFILLLYIFYLNIMLF